MASTDLHQRLVRVVDWVHRTGWPRRASDTALAADVFDAWWADARAVEGEGQTMDRYVLIEALATVLGNHHDAEGVEHLCALFAAVFEAHIRARQDGAAGDA